jgi:hypothetical protein
MDSKDNIRERLEALEHQTHTLARQARWWRGLACGIMVLGLLSGALPSGQTVDAHRRDLSARVAELEDKLQFVTVSEDEMVITRANLRIVNGLGKTDCGSEFEEPIPDCPNGLGNLIIGYNEERPPNAEGSPVTNTRTGSHNIVVGKWHDFSRFGGIVVGRYNTISGDYASVSGGSGNAARGSTSSVSGGNSNTARGFASAVSGGYLNTASGIRSAVSGGDRNTASGDQASVSGGGNNWASGIISAVSGGSNHTASGIRSAVSGGSFNTASGKESSVSGGSFNTASGEESSVSGGTNRSALEEHNWAAGSLLEAN